MKWLEIFRFELTYRKVRPATYIYFVLALGISFALVTTDSVKTGTQVMENSPFVISNILSELGVIFMMVASAVMGVSVLRDFEHHTHTLFFTTPISKADYLFGRFLGSLLVTGLIFSGLMLGMMAGEFAWWRDGDNLLAFDMISYLKPFVVLVLPNMLFVAAVFFASGALSRNMMVIYMQAIVLLVLYLVGSHFAREMESRELAAMLDPFGEQAYALQTRYMTTAEKNSIQISLSGWLLYNRLLWMGMSLLILFATYKAFSFNVVLGKKGKKKKEVEETKVEAANVVVPKVQLHTGLGTSILQVWKHAIFYSRLLFRQVPFLGIAICGMIMAVLIAYNSFNSYGTTTLPVTYATAEIIFGGFGLFFLIIIAFYTAEMVWMERSVKTDQIIDAYPVQDAVPLVSKAIGLILANVVLMFGLVLCGMLTQAIKGYFNFELSVYMLQVLQTLPFVLFYTLVGIFFQSVINHKFMGMVAVLLFYFLTISLSGLLEVEHPMFQFGRTFSGNYSDMNGVGHYLPRFSYHVIYWTTFTLLLFGVAVLLNARGTDTLFKQRLQKAKGRLGKGMISFLSIAALSFTLSGCLMYYNYNVADEYTHSDQDKELQANYEKTLSKYKQVPQPKIVDVNLKVEIYPETRSMETAGYYLLRNTHSQPISEVHLQLQNSNNVDYTQMELQGATLKEELKDYAFNIYALEQPLQPGDTLRLDWALKLEPDGFGNESMGTRIVQNGTFFNNAHWFPTIGYNEGYELQKKDDRKDYDLAEQEDMAEQDDEWHRSINLFGDDADMISFEIVLGTSEDQIAIAPGYLQKKWTENGRHYFHYKTDAPMVNFFSMVSARYEVMKDQWVPAEVDSINKPVNLEIYYHKDHAYNLDRMMKGMKASLDYYTANFSPFQFKQLRIMEFPRYASFAQSFANTVPFSESIGFIMDIDEKDKEEVDVAFYVTAHEVAHQWWGHQVCEAQVKGSSMLSEAMSQYSALMVMKHQYPRESIRKFLKHELDKYLTGRAMESKRERPLAEVERQQYIHYNKGSVVFFALQDYIGEDSLNKALRNYQQEWAYRTDRYPATQDLLKHIRAVTPDSMQYVITDMFETITLFENRADTVSYTQQADSTYQVELSLTTEKYRADSLGVEQAIAVADWIDVGIYTEDENGDEKLIYLEKHKFTDKENKLTITVDQKPTKAGVDPLHKLIDRHTNDNTKTAKLKALAM
ncbi:M1 family aminopeptidase [Limibacter armeniacum]|uniref:ABC transporter permease/M1 family aminopeptidase n=1 Tax=Limibacter armeniacum TaxID=466084 RepID=UPI002FE6BBF1